MVDAVDVPVIAAGGIADGRGTAAVSMLGASGVQIGTAFLTSPEPAVGDIHRAELLGTRARRTTVTRNFLRSANTLQHDAHVKIPVSGALRAEMREAFRFDVQLLSSLIGRDLSHRLD